MSTDKITNTKNNINKTKNCKDISDTFKLVIHR